MNDIEFTTVLYAKKAFVNETSNNRKIVYNKPKSKNINKKKLKKILKELK